MLPGAQSVCNIHTNWLHVSRVRPTDWQWLMTWISTGMCACQMAACIMNTTDELASRMSNGDIAGLQTSDLGLFWHDSVWIQSLTRG